LRAFNAVRAGACFVGDYSVWIGVGGITVVCIAVIFQLRSPRSCRSCFFQLTLKLCKMEFTSLALIGLLAMIVVITVIALATS
jgi:hypothetical protein